MDYFGKDYLFGNGTIGASYKELSESMPTHVHDFFEIEYVIEGTGTYIVDGNEYEIRDGMLFFMSPASFHSFEHFEAKIINLMFPCNICDTSILFHFFLKKKGVVFAGNSHDLIEKLLDRIVVCCQKGDYNYAINFLQCLLYELNSLSSDSTEQFTSHVQSTIMYITENYRKNITLNSAAKHVGVVPAYLSKIFLKEIGVNFKTYLDNLRFEHAKMLLEFSDINITDVCTQSGFIDYTNFNKRFKQRYKVTPKTYRSLHKKKQ